MSSDVVLAEVCQASSGVWQYRTRGSDGHVVAVSDATYPSRSVAWAAATLLGVPVLDPVIDPVVDPIIDA